MRQDMTVQEVMEYQGRLYYMKKAEIREKTEQLLSFTDLIDHRKKTVRYLSGGMKRKLMVCRGLMTDPDVLLLDEPTAGMDAIARRQMWALLRRINNRKMTIILTTHYMEEAEALCDRVALINKGKLGEVDSPAALIEALGKYAVDLVTEADTKSVYFKTREEAIAYLETIPSEAAHASLRNTTLEDVFVERIGRRLTVR
jgi:ABC-2 type transport system ATP-binding protein